MFNCAGTWEMKVKSVFYSQNGKKIPKVDGSRDEKSNIQALVEGLSVWQQLCSILCVVSIFRIPRTGSKGC
jgi:hypothetical protein